MTIQKDCYRVGVFRMEGKRKPRYNAYTVWFNESWPGCCVHYIGREVGSGTAAKKRAIEEHKMKCEKS